MKTISELFLTIIRETIEAHGLKPLATHIMGDVKISYMRGQGEEYPDRADASCWVLDEDYEELNRKKFKDVGGAHKRGTFVSHDAESETWELLCDRLPVSKAQSFDITYRGGLLFLECGDLSERLSSYAEFRDATRSVLVW